MRNARLDAWETNLGTSPKFRVYAGAVPADANAAATGSLIVELTLPVDWMNNAASAQKTKLGTWSGAATLAGTNTPTYVRLYDSGVTACGGQFTAGVGTGEVSFDGNITLGQTVTVNTFTLTEGNP
jgi:hypothetical protein